MKLTNAVIACMLAAVSITAAFATPSTLVWIPSTDIQADKTWHLGVDNYFTPKKGTSIVDVGPEYGFLGGKAEVGVDYMGGQDNPIYFNVKYLVAPEKPKTPAFAVGIYNVGTKSGVSDDDMVFGLGSKTFGPARFTLGYCQGKKSTLGQGEKMLMAGVDGILSKNKKWWGAVDYQSGNSAFGALNFGVSYAFSDNTSVIFGYDIYNNKTLNPKNTITTQLDINF